MVASLLETILITNLYSRSSHFAPVPRWVRVVVLQTLGCCVGLPPKPPKDNSTGMVLLGYYHINKQTNTHHKKTNSMLFFTSLQYRGVSRCCKGGDQIRWECSHGPSAGRAERVGERPPGNPAAGGPAAEWGQEHRGVDPVGFHHWSLSILALRPLPISQLYNYDLLLGSFIQALKRFLRKVSLVHLVYMICVAFLCTSLIASYQSAV